MMKNKESIKRAYRRACLDYLYQLLDDWGLYEKDDDITKFGWWVGDEIGGVFCLEDDTFINMDEIRYCVDNNIDYDTYQDYLEYATKCYDFGFDHMNLNAFVIGAPRVSNEEFERLEMLQKNLDDAINDIKDKMGV